MHSRLASSQENPGCTSMRLSTDGRFSSENNFVSVKHYKTSVKFATR